MTGSVQLSFLADHPGFIDVLAPEICAHWSAILGEDTLTARLEKMRRHLNRDRLPIAWVAHRNGEVLSTAALRACDLEGCEERMPWLGGVFVRPQFRSQGVASVLCAEVSAFARVQGYRDLFLFTLDRQSLYGRLGWIETERRAWKGRDCSIMVKSLL